MESEGDDDNNDDVKGSEGDDDNALKKSGNKN